MWRRQDQPKPSSETAENSAAPAVETAAAAASSPSPSPAAVPSHAASNPIQRASMAAAVSFESRLTGSLKIKGDITGRDALLVDAQVIGRIQLDGGSVTVGPHGQVNASINAREIDIHGQIKGDLHGHDRVRIGATAQTHGQIVSRRVAIEDGAIVRGRVEVTHHASADGPKPEQAAASHTVAAPSAPVGRSTPGPVAVPSPAKEPTAAA